MPTIAPFAYLHSRGMPSLRSRRAQSPQHAVQEVILVKTEALIVEHPTATVDTQVLAAKNQQPQTRM
jgi:hypothetical protein